MMDLDRLTSWMAEHFTAEAFHLEARQIYEVPTDGSDFRRYLDGATTWTPERKEPWLEHLQRERALGLRRHRVRLVTHPVTPYTRYECEWSYLPNTDAGEEVRILDTSERQVPDLGDFAAQDWWLLTDRTGADHVAVLQYDTNGEYLGALEVNESARFVEARNLLVDAAEDFADWWKRHADTLARQPGQVA